VLILTTLSMALAQDIPVPELDAQHYRTPIDARYTLWSDDTTVAPDGYWLTKLSFDYVNGPVGAIADAAGNESVILRDAVSVDVVGGVSWSRIRVGLDLPVYLLSTSDLDIGGAGLGDLALDVRGVIIDNRDNSAQVGLAASARAQLPTATLTTPLGAGKATFEPSVIVDRHFGERGLVALNLGYRVGPTLDAANLQLNDQFVFRAGGGYAPIPEAGVSLDLAGRVDTRMTLNDPANAPVELLAGGWVRPAQEGLVVRMGMGSGLTRGIGSPVYRLLLSVGWEPPFERDTDGDGLLDNVDQCKSEPEDRDAWQDADGCPDPDNDSDGVVDDDDVCPNEPEDVDTWKDDDGCPDPETQVTLTAVDPKGQPIPSASLALGESQGVGEVVVEVAPGTLVATASALGFVSGEASFDLTDGAPTALTIQLDPAGGELHIEVKDPDGNPLNATWRLADGVEGEISGGLAEVALAIGEHEVVIEAPDFAPTTERFALENGQTHDIVVVLEPTRVKVAAERIEISGKVNFELSSAVIKSDSFGLLDEVASVLVRHPELLLIRIEGHTDSQGAAAYNLSLSQQRADSVRAYLVEHGVASNRLEAEGFGETRLLDTSNTGKAHATNRRVDLFVAMRVDDE
jgi:outer membrane protein OmpA-like peptidoglycan-associated protein